MKPLSLSIQRPLSIPRPLPRALAAILAATAGFTCLETALCASSDGEDPGLDAAIERAVSEESLEAVWQVGTPFVGVDGAWQAPNRGQGLRSYFLSDGVSVVPVESGAQPAFTFGMRFAGSRRGAGESRSMPTEPQVAGGRIEYEREGLVEWYVNGERGLELGFDIAQRPFADEAGALELELGITGDLTLDDLEAGRFFLADARGTRLLSVSGLRAWDADERPLACRFEERANGLAIVVDDGGARYPIVVDPTVSGEDAILTPTLSPRGGVGRSIAVFGNRAVVGAPEGMGCAYILNRQPSGQWVPGTKLVPEDGDVGWEFGSGVTTFDDWIIVGSPGSGGFGGEGAVYAFKFDQMEGVWEQRQKILPSQANTVYSVFGRVVDMTDQYLAVSDPLARRTAANQGIVQVYRLSGNTWNPDHTIFPPDTEANAFAGASLDLTFSRLAIGMQGQGNQGEVRTYAFDSQTGEYEFEAQLLTSVMADNGYSVDLAGSFLLSGSPSTAGGRGIVVLWERSGGNWIERLNVQGIAVGERFGSKVVMRTLGTGVRALVSAPDSDLQVNDGGRVAVLEGSGSGLTQVATLLQANPVSNQRLGRSALFVGEDFALVGSHLAHAVHAFEANGTSWTHIQRFDGRDHDPGDLFGSSVAISGDFAVVGARFDDEIAFHGGAAHVFRRVANEWQHADRLDAGNDAQRLAEYGASVALSANAELIIVGASAWDGTGTALVHLRTITGNSWTTGSRLTYPENTLNAGYGIAVDVANDLAVVGAHHANGGSANSGAVYVWRRLPIGVWTLEQKLQDPGGQFLDGFGRSVAITDFGEILVGAPFKNVSAVDSGQVFRYTFNGSSWTLAGTLAPSTVGAFEGFGQSLSTEGDRLAVGGPLGATGNVYLFRRPATSWLEETTIAGEFGFGRSVGIDGGLMAVSSIDRAWAYIESGGAWAPTELFPTTGPIQSFSETTQVAVSGPNLLVGADADPGAGELSGAAFLFVPLPASDIGTNYCGPAQQNSTGARGAISAFGSDCVADNNVTLTAEQLPAGQFGYFIVGMNQGSSTPPGSSGLLCLSGNIGRYNGDIGVGPSFDLQIDLTSIPVNPPAPVGAGQTWNFQAWYRDVGTSNFTDGISIAFQ